MKKFIKSKISFIALLMLFSLFNTACKKDIETKDYTQIEESASIESILNSLKVGPSQDQNSHNPEQTQNAIDQYLCFEFSYPFSLMYNDGTTQIIANDTEFSNAIVNQTNTHYIIDFVYPFEVILENGTTQTIHNDLEFSDLINSCQTISPNGPVPTMAYCFDFIYPITLVYNDGTTLVVNNDQEFDDAYINGTQSHYIDHISFPIDVLDQNGQTETINDAVAFQALIDSCYGSTVYLALLPPSDFFGGCFELNYPVTLVYNDNTTLTVNNNQEYDDTLTNSTTQHYIVDFEYDISVTQNGNTVVVHDINGFFDLYINCVPTPDYTDLLCFTFNYPIDVIMSDGTTVTVNNDTEMNAIMAATPNTPPYFVDFVYPFTVEKDGVTITINNQTEFNDLINSCN